MLDRLDDEFLGRWVTFRLRVDGESVTLTADGEQHSVLVEFAQPPDCRIVLGIQGDIASVPPVSADYDQFCQLL